MPPLILHNVPDDELYVGDDGIKRPFAMVFPQTDGGSFGRTSRKTAHESGSFGKSTRRSRSKTGTPARREDPTITAADKVFSGWISAQNEVPAPIASNPATTTTQRRSNSAQTSLGQGVEEAAPPVKSTQQPTEVILRGYGAMHQYAAINHYEQLAGRICEDYSREPPVEIRRRKSTARDVGYMRRKPLTADELAKANRAASGDYWVKVTFESAGAADAAIYASPQSILGHLVFAEFYTGNPPPQDEPVIDTSSLIMDEDHVRAGRPTRTTSSAPGFARAMRNPDSFDFEPAPLAPSRNGRPTNAGGGVSAFARAMMNPDSFDFEPPRSLASSRTADTATAASIPDTNTVTSGTVTGNVFATGTDLGDGIELQPRVPRNEDEFCQAIPTVRKVRLLPVEQALLPAPSFTQKVLNVVPVVKWFSGSMIGNEVPRTESGEFDWDRASLYWKIIWWLDDVFGLFGKEIVSADKDD